MTTNQIDVFLKSQAFAVLGASSNRSKYGNKVLRCYLQNGKTVYPVNPHEELIEGLTVVSAIADLPKDVNSISVITPPEITELIVEESIRKGIQNIWIQPGAENEIAIKNCIDHQINVISGGPCILVTMGYQE